MSSRSVFFTCFLVFVALVSFNEAQLTGSETNFFLGTWYSVATSPEKITYVDCCVPTGKITFSKDKNLKIKASQWKGGFCDELYLGRDSSLIFDKLSSEANYNALAGKFHYFNKFYIQGTARDLDTSRVFNNGTQQVTFDLLMSYTVTDSRYGKLCSVTLSKSETPIIQ